MNVLNIANVNNTNVTHHNFENCPNLTCIQVDNKLYADTNFYNVDPTSSFSTNCNYPCYVNIPDANFKTYLLGNTAINTNGNTEIESSEAQAYTGAIVCPNLNITDLKGIGAFENITYLDYRNNNVTSTDLTSNIALEKIIGQSNTALSSLDLSNLVNLKYANFRGYSLQEIDFTDNIFLDTIDFWGNDLDTIDVTHLNNLTYLNVNNSNLTSLDVSNNLNLIRLDCGGNLINSIDLSMLTNLVRFNASGNNLTEIDVTNNLVLSHLALNTSPGISSIDLSNNTALEKLYLGYSNMSSVDVSNNPNLVTFDIYNSNFVEIDLSNNPLLMRLHARDNLYLERLNLASGGANLLSNYQNFNNCPNLTCIQVDDVAYADANFTIKDARTIYSLDCGYCFTSQDVIDTLICQGETYTSPNLMVLDSSGVYFDTIQNACGSDSIIEINLNVLNNEITNINGTLEATTGFNTYQWFKDSSPITNETNYSYTPLESGNYYCEAGLNSCTSTSNTIKIELETSINETTFDNFNIYPNPTNGIINLEMDETLTTIKLFDITGKMIQSIAPKSKKIDLEKINAGIYFLEISNNEKKHIVKLVKK